jgi:hypothetical protein
MRLERLVIVALSSIVVGFLVYNIFFNKPITDDKYSKQKREIDSLNTLILGLEKQKLVQDSIIKINTDSIGELAHKIEDNNKKIQDIRHYYGEKIKHINDANSTELSDFFTERYK